MATFVSGHQPHARFKRGDTVLVKWPSSEPFGICGYGIRVDIIAALEYRVYEDKHAEIPDVAENPRREYRVDGLTWTVPEGWIQPEPKFNVGDDVCVQWSANSHKLFNLSIVKIHEYRIWDNCHGEINEPASNPRREYGVGGLAYTVPEEWIERVVAAPVAPGPVGPVGPPSPPAAPTAPVGPVGPGPINLDNNFYGDGRTHQLSLHNHTYIFAWTEETKLGRGNYSTVFKATRKSASGTEEDCAAKVVNMKTVHQVGNGQAMDREKKILEKIRDETEANFFHLLKYHGSHVFANNFQVFFSELLPISLEGYLEQKRRGITLPNAKRMFEGLLMGLKQLHALNIVHRDIKPVNIMLTTISEESAALKLIDFGFSRVLEVPTLNYQDTWTVGTPLYMDPNMKLYLAFFNRQMERPEDIPNYDFSADLYSVALVLGCMLIGSPKAIHTYFEESFIKGDASADDGNCYAKFVTSVLAGVANEIEKVHPRESNNEKEVVDLLEKMLNEDRSSRLNMNGVWEHPFLHPAEVAAVPAEEAAVPAEEAAVPAEDEVLENSWTEISWTAKEEE